MFPCQQPPDTVWAVDVRALANHLIILLTIFGHQIYRICLNISDTDIVATILYNNNAGFLILQARQDKFWKYFQPFLNRGSIIYTVTCNGERGSENHY